MSDDPMEVDNDHPITNLRTPEWASDYFPSDDEYEEFTRLPYGTLGDHPIGIVGRRYARQDNEQSYVRRRLIFPGEEEAHPE